MEQPNMALVVPVLIVFVIFLGWALIDLIRRDRNNLRGNEIFGNRIKFIWLAVILFLNFTGPFLYLMLARKPKPKQAAMITETEETPSTSSL